MVGTRWSASLEFGHLEGNVQALARMVPTGLARSVVHLLIIVNGTKDPVPSVEDKEPVCWQFDLSPSDLKEVKEPSWLKANKGVPTLMLFSAVDDRSGVAYQEYRCVYVC